MSDVVVVSHFFNEELLLPYWLDHHTRLFSHGVLIDYASTDNSVAICKEMAPDWEIVPSKNELFSAQKCDDEVMEIERKFDNCWKMALNTTEFLLAPDIQNYVDAVSMNHPHSNGFRAQGVYMADPEEHWGNPLNRSPLILQRHWGRILPQFGRDRMIHKAEDGKYGLGRHQTYLGNILPYGNDIYLLWYGFAPWPQVKDRKMQIQDRMDPEDKRKGLGAEHVATSEQMDEAAVQNAAGASDLLLDEDFAKVWRETMKSLYDLPILYS